MNNELIAARTFCAPDTGAVKAGDRITALSSERIAELRAGGFIEADAVEVPAAEPESEWQKFRDIWKG